MDMIIYMFTINNSIRSVQKWTSLTAFVGVDYYRLHQ